VDFEFEILKEIEKLKRQVAYLRRLEKGDTDLSGWIEIPDGSWSYASATTITVPSGAASIYAVGDLIRLKQGGAYKYYYVVGIADTVLTVTGGTDYTVANATITDVAYCKGGGVGHPGKFSYTPTIAYYGGTTNPTSMSANFSFSLSGKGVLIVGTGFLTRGSGDRTSTAYSFPFTMNTIGPVTYCSTFAGAWAKLSGGYAEIGTLLAYHNTMVSDGYYWLNFTSFI